MSDESVPGSACVVLIALPVRRARSCSAAMSGAPVKTVKLTALAFSLAELVVVVALWIAYRSSMGDGLDQVAVPFRETFSVDWIPSFGISFSLGVDGISLTMIALIAVLMPIVLGASWEEKLPAGRTIGGYFALLLVLQGAMIGVFAATNVFVFYVMFEVMLIPMYFLIGAFGGVRRAYAATKFFLYSLLGGLLMLASVIGLYVASGRHAAAGGTFDWVDAAVDRQPDPGVHPDVDLRRVRHRVRDQGAAGAAAHLAARRRYRGAGRRRHAAGRRAGQGRHLRLPADLPAAAAGGQRQAGLADHPAGRASASSTARSSPPARAT